MQEENQIKGDPGKYITGCLTVRETVSAAGKSNRGKLLEAGKPTGPSRRKKLNG